MARTDQYTWDLSSLYSSPDDPALERDVERIERAYKRFVRRYRDEKNWLAQPGALAAALEDYESLLELPKPLMYLSLLKAVHTDNKTIDARINQVHARIVAAANEAIFFTLSLGSIPREKQRAFLASKKLAPYHYILTRIFEEGKYNLTEKEHTLLNALEMPREDMWITLTERLLGESEVAFENGTLPLSEAMNKVSNLQTSKRRLLHMTIMDELRSHADVAEAEINALYTSKYVIDTRRGFRDPIEETRISFETTKKELAALRGAIGEAKQTSHDFFKAKKRLLNLSTLTYADRNADIGKINRSFSFDESLEILRDVFGAMHPQFRAILDDMIENRRIDAFPRKHKESGGFCAGSTGFPTYVLLNDVSTYNSLTTFAHEMGHAIHTELSKRERPLYQGYSIAVAEFASTFFEDMVFNALYDTFSKSEQRVLLHNRINRDIASTFRQMAYFEFELELHEAVRARGYVPKEDIAAMFTSHMRAHMGDAVELDERDGYYFVILSHIRRYFYVYSYAYGGLLSRIASERSKDDTRMFDKVVELLSSGSSESPKRLFKKLGIYTEQQQTFTEGLDMITNDIDTLTNM